MAAECLCFRARRVSRTLTRMYDRALRPLGIQATQLTLLNAIALQGRAVTDMPRLSFDLALDPATLSRSLRALEKAGLVHIRAALDDRRARLVRLTPEGERMLAAALPRWKRAHARVVAALGTWEAADLRDRFDATIAAAAKSP
jgi:DNA-binding MarR family transcriptional regulator